MKYLIKNKWWDIVEEYNIDKILYLLVDRPDKVEYLCWNNENMSWFSKKQYHRNYDLPAVVYKMGNVYYMKNGMLHREDSKPADIDTVDNFLKFYYNGKLTKTVYK